MHTWWRMPRVQRAATPSRWACAAQLFFEPMSSYGVVWRGVAQPDHSGRGFLYCALRRTPGSLGPHQETDSHDEILGVEWACATHLPFQRAPLAGWGLVRGAAPAPGGWCGGCHTLHKSYNAPQAGGVAGAKPATDDPPPHAFEAAQKSSITRTTSAGCSK